MQSYFLRHEGYLGSVGAFMMGPAQFLKKMAIHQMKIITRIMLKLPMEFNIERFTKHQTGQPSTHAIAINWPEYQNFQH